MKTLLCRTEAETEALGGRLVQGLPLPARVMLYGDLGAGKTALVRGMGRALGTEDVMSPTFTIIHEYDTVPPLVHIDAYRLDGGEALLDIGFSDYLNAGNIIVVEWAELVEDVLPVERLNIRITAAPDGIRELTLTPVGKVYERTVEAL